MLHGFNPHSPLNYLVRDYFSKLVSLELVLTCLYVYSMTSQIHLVRYYKRKSHPNPHILYASPRLGDARLTTISIFLLILYPP